MRNNKTIFLSLLTIAPFLAAIVFKSAAIAVFALPLSIISLVIFDKFETYGLRYATVNYRYRRVKTTRKLRIFKHNLPIITFVSITLPILPAILIANYFLTGVKGLRVGAIDRFEELEIQNKIIRAIAYTTIYIASIGISILTLALAPVYFFGFTITFTLSALILLLRNINEPVPHIKKGFYYDYNNRCFVSY